ncbi:GxGYxYP family putative glycoside hydrolase [Paenibacillus sp. LHD-117]|uniref:GxGYxYP domain-containing protein n=1 Tax=Paenibacillus sp. LHD-117 TaxID=3071412 RepID=UPI0027E1D466|nr:GxGYxYP domain-containing protein [Paenibacillus sp. LHD-117]MDQ6423023.1 GxGYxYP family putative glycoside hydrolase [Paenibacillus sp. LHD-117]
MIRKLTAISMALVCTLSLSAGAYAEPAPEKSHANTISWPKDQALPSFARAKQLEVADIYDAPGDVKLLFSSLQGIVNRKEPRIYLLENKEEGKFKWLNDLDVDYKVRDDYWDILKKFKKEIKGLIIYDPNVPDSINVATTLAGLRDGLAVSPELVEQLKAAPYGLTVIEDLQGKFKDRIDAYTWQYENLWKETSHRMLIGLSPEITARAPIDQPNRFETVAQETTEEREAANRDVYDIGLSDFLGKPDVYVRFEDAFTQDGWGTALHELTIKADGQTIAHFVPGTPEEEAFLYDPQSSQLSTGSGGHRFADNGRYFTYKFTPPAGTKELVLSADMWNQYKVSAGNDKPFSSKTKEPYGYLRDYAVANKAMVFWLESNVPEEKALFEKILSGVKPGTPYLGWFSNDFEGEFSGVEIASSHGAYVLAADWFSNLTVFSGTKPESYKSKAPKPVKLENKIYVTYTFSEGDNFQYNQHRLRVLWDDPSRGKVPINWTSSPLLYDAAPAMLNYFRGTATANDQIIAGPSGAGYFYPDAWPDSSFATFLKDTKKYLKKTGMDIPYVLNRVDGQNIPLSKSKNAAYRDVYEAPGIFLSWDNYTKVEIVDGLPTSTIQGISTANDGKNVLAEAKKNWDGKSPLFLSLGLLAWSMTPSDVVEVTKSLGPEYEVVLADQYFSLIRQANGLPAKP